MRYTHTLSTCVLYLRYTIRMAFGDPKHIVAQLGLVPGMKVADFGAGAGYLSLAVAEKVAPGGTVYVIDIQQELLTKVTSMATRQHLESFVYVHADLETPRGSTLADDSQDAVIISNLMFQVAENNAIVQEAYRVLRGGGKLLIVDWRESYGGMGPQPEHVFTEEQARTIATDAGFRVEGTIDAGSYHYGLIFIK